MKKVFLYTSICFFAMFSLNNLNASKIKEHKSLNFLSNNQHLTEASPEVMDLKEVLITKIISEPEGGIIHDLLVELNQDDSIENIIRRNPSNTQTINFRELSSGEVVLAEAAGRKALLMSCPQCSVNSGGVVHLRYLYNGMSMSYRTLKMNIIYRDSKWLLETLDNKKINTQ